MLRAKKGGIKLHFFNLWYDLTWDWTLVFQTIREHSTHFYCNIINWLALLLTCSVAFKQCFEPLNTWNVQRVNSYDWQPLNSGSFWDYGCHWMISVKWQNCSRLRNKLVRIAQLKQPNSPSCGFPFNRTGDKRKTCKRRKVQWKCSCVVVLYPSRKKNSNKGNEQNKDGVLKIGVTINGDTGNGLKNKANWRDGNCMLAE